jgi:transposase
MTHDYVRHGTTSLFAAYVVTGGSVIAQSYRRHRHREFLRFLKVIDAAVPRDLDLHLALDNYAAHKTPEIQKWLIRHPRFGLHFTPTSSSRLNLVERWFAELTNRKPCRSAHRSVTELEDDIRKWINEWNKNPRPFSRTKSADDILETIAVYCRRIAGAAGIIRRGAGRSECRRARRGLVRRHPQGPARPAPPALRPAPPPAH